MMIGKVLSDALKALDTSRGHFVVLICVFVGVSVGNHFGMQADERLLAALLLWIKANDPVKQ
jgi:hypothetical protein